MGVPATSVAEFYGLAWRASSSVYGAPPALTGSERCITKPISACRARTSHAAMQIPAIGSISRRVHVEVPRAVQLVHAARDGKPITSARCHTTCHRENSRFWQSRNRRIPPIPAWQCDLHTATLASQWWQSRPYSHRPSRVVAHFLLNPYLHAEELAGGT